MNLQFSQASEIFNRKSSTSESFNRKFCGAMDGGVIPITGILSYPTTGTMNGGVIPLIQTFLYTTTSTAKILDPILFSSYITRLQKK